LKTHGAGEKCRPVFPIQMLVMFDWQQCTCQSTTEC